VTLPLSYSRALTNITYDIHANYYRQNHFALADRMPQTMAASAANTKVAMMV
jgi:hypothetical protein